ncbi:MAG: hypothetical protein GC180_11740 [Bacteroidetes bacterium]|nr:hypothetical protein [Bacteroidota bacterium]
MLIRTFILTILLALSHLPLNSKTVMEDEEWHFVAIMNAVKFYWREDPAWHFLEIKAENSSSTFVNYEYEFKVFEGNSMTYSGKNKWVRLRRDDFNVIRVSKQFDGINQVKLEKLRVEMYR